MFEILFTFHFYILVVDNTIIIIAQSSVLYMF